MAVRFNDFSGRHVDWVARMPQPATLVGVRQEVMNAERDGLTVSAEGSAWAFSAPAYNPGVVIDTSKLYGFPEWLQDCVVRPPGSSEILVAVEAGIEIRNLYLALEGAARRDDGPPVPDSVLPRGRRLTLPTLGGAGGQSLAGVVNTGTHGGDVARPPIGDYVRAAILVGSGGRVRVVQRPGPERVLDVERLNARHAAHSGGATFESYDRAGALEAVTVAVGRLGVVYAYVYAVADETGMFVFERRRKSVWSTMRNALDAGQLLDEARAGDQFLQIVMSPLRNAGEDRPCFVTEHKLLPETRVADAYTEFGLDRVASMPVDEARFSEVMEFIGQTFSVDRVTPQIEAIQMALRAAALLAVGTAGSLPVVGPVLFLGAVPLAAALWEFADALGTINRSRLFGDVVADFLNRFTGGVLNFAVVALMRGLVENGQTDRRPDEQPWLVHGTRPRVADFYDYRYTVYRGDSVEVFFLADGGLSTKVQSLLDMCERMQREGQPLAAYISLRFLAPSSALLATTIASPDRPTCTIEIAMLRGVRANDDALAEIQRIALEGGGRVHWGQQNDLSAGQVSDSIPGVSAWKQHLAQLEGASSSFLTPFARYHGLEVDQPVDWSGWSERGLIAASDPAVADIGRWGTPGLAIVAIDQTGRVVLTHHDGSAARTEWRQIRDEQMDAATRPAIVRRLDDGRLEVFARSTDAQLGHTYQEEPDGRNFSRWDYKRTIWNPVPITSDFLHAAMPGRIEVFAHEPGPRSRLLHSGIAGHGWGPLEPVDETPVDAHVAVAGRSKRLPDGQRVHSFLLVTTRRDDGAVMWRLLDAPPEWKVLPALPGGYAALTLTVAHDRLLVSSAGGVFEARDTQSQLAPDYGSWRQLPVAVAGDRLHPAGTLVARAVGDSLWVAGRGERGEVLATRASPGGWDPWISLGGKVDGELALGISPSGLELVARRAGDRQLMSRTQTAPDRW